MSRRNRARPTATIARSEPSAASDSRRRTTILSTALIALVAVAVYANSFAGDFVFDDHAWIETNPNIRQLWPIGPIFAPAGDEALGGRPVVNLTLAINYALAKIDSTGKPDVWGFHAVNLAIHILAAWTLFGIVRRTFALPALSERFGAVATPLALAVGLLWVIHPLQTQAVTYLIQRSESLAALFYLLALYCVIRGAGVRSQGSGARRESGDALEASAASASLTTQASSLKPSWWSVAAVAACALGMATKEIMVTAPLVVLLYDRAFLSGSFRRALAGRWGLYLGLAATWGIVVWALVATHFHGGTTGFAVSQFTSITYLLTQPGVLVHYLRLAFWPTGLSINYGWPAAQTFSQIVWPCLVILGLLGLTGWALVKRPMLGFLGAACFLILAPTSSFVPIRDAAFDHRMYLPLAAVMLLAALGVWSLCQRIWTPVGERRNPVSAARWLAPTAILVAALIGFGSTTIARNDVYRSEFALWQDAVRTNPNYAVNQLNYGIGLYRLGQHAEGIRHCQRAVELDPGHAQARVNLGIMLGEQQQQPAAIAQFREALRLKDTLEAHFDLGMALYSNGETREAVEQWRKADEMKPDQFTTINLIAWVLATDAEPAVRDGAEAVTLAQRALDLARQDNSESARAHEPGLLATLAASYAETERYDEAQKAANEAIRLASLRHDATFVETVRNNQLECYLNHLPYHRPRQHAAPPSNSPP